MKRWKKLTVQLISGLTIFLLPVSVCAQVNTTREQTFGTAIYVAGNPDLYPIEYYNENTENYEGVLPELYRRIAEEYDLDLCYVSAGKDNCQQRLAGNNQVELVSAHYEGDIRSLKEEYNVVSFEKDGKQYDICIGFTDIASDDIKEILKKELENADDKLLLSGVLAETAEMKSTYRVPRACIAATVALAVVCVLLFICILRKRRRDKKKEETAQIDPMTGIGNSEYFKYEFSHYISAESFSLYYIAYISLEISQLHKYFGDEKAVEIQVYAANILSSDIADTDFAAHIDDGVFVLAFQASSEKTATQRVSELLDRLNAYEDNFVQEYHVPFRAGVYGISSASVSCETSIFNARQGYNYALQNKQQLCYSDKAFLGNEKVKVRLQRKLTDAISKNQFSMFLQFIVEPDSGRICGAEALSRWMDMEEGQLLPVNYIDSLINVGIIDRLDFYIFEQVCKQLEQWDCTKYQDLFISCNFARPTVAREDFLPRLREISERYKFQHCNLLLEMTEDAMADNQAMVFQNMLACKEMGFRIALDDLGSGYTSLRDLCEYPVDVIKIDRHIVLKSVTKKGNALLTGIVRLARDLGMEVLCEGVETEEQNRIVRDAECDYIQGYYYSRVFPMEHAMEFYDRYMNKR